MEALWYVFHSRDFPLFYYAFCIGKIQTVMGVIFLVSMLFKLIVIQCPPYPAWSLWSFVNALKGTAWETVMGYAH